MRLVPPRFGSILRYLKATGLPYGWRISKGACPLCGHTWYLAFRPTAFMTRCLKCLSNVTNLSLIPVIQKHVGALNKDTAVYELSTYGCTVDWLKHHFKNVTMSEFFPEWLPGETRDGVLNQDVQQLTFPDNTFDVVTSNQVFEHVADDKRGFSECCRVLKPGGALILTIPLFENVATNQIAKIEGNKVVFFGQPEYHDSRIGGPQSAPVFWHHSRSDIVGRIKSTGFTTVELTEVLLTKCQRVPATVIYAVK